MRNKIKEGIIGLTAEQQQRLSDAFKKYYGDDVDWDNLTNQQRLDMIADFFVNRMIEFVKNREEYTVESDFTI